ncbi:major facilitator superfamily domain-containing protein, partial [Fusarium oxysporum f. sp. albedinis]
NNYVQAGLSSEDAQFLAAIPLEEQSRIFRKVDWRLVPFLGVLYLIAHLDRANIGNAKIEGLEASLGMSDTDYNVAVAVFFIPYVLCEVPSNYLLSKFSRASFYMGTLVCQWYPPHKSQARMALFYMASALAGAFSGLLAAAIAKLDGAGGYEGWRWIFLLEGIASVIAGVMTFFVLPNSPKLAKWLTTDEVRFLELMHAATRGKATVQSEESSGNKKNFKWGVLWSIIKDWQLYLQAMVMASNSVPNYALKVTMPQIIRNMGFTTQTSQLLTAPPYICGAISAVVAAYYADRLRWRMPFIVASQSLLIVAYAVLFVKADDIANSVAVCYFCVFLACIGVYPIIPGCLAWTINNLAQAEKRAMGIAFMMMMGNSGGLVGSFIFLEKEKPKYSTGFGGSLAFATAGIACALTLELLYWRSNKSDAKYTEDEVKAKYTDEELYKMGDRCPLFKYGL